MHRKSHPCRFTDLSNTSRQAQNNVSFTVSGLVAGEDRVLVGPRSGSNLDRGMWLVSTALTALAETSLVCKTGTNTVPFPDAEENWPDSGTGADVSRLRIERDDGIYQLIPYDSHDGTDTFTEARWFSFPAGCADMTSQMFRQIPGSAQSAPTH